MTTPPARPMLYHITHVDNLRAIVADDALVSDAEMMARGGPAQAIGMSAIKWRRVDELPVDCHPGTKVGDYVPFHFCPRSVMLYLIHCANHPELVYRGGQGPIVHLEADLHEVIRWVEANGGRWAFSLSNAGAYYTEFRSRLEEMDQLDWAAIAATNFRAPEVKERTRPLPARPRRTHRRAVRGHPGACCDGPRGRAPSAGDRGASGMVLLRQEARR